jgi:putative oxidoreductase
MKRTFIIYELVVLLFITMFIYAAVSKLLIFPVYKLQLGAQPFNKALTPFLAWGIPSVEVLVSVMLVFPKTRLKGLYIATLLMIVFTAYIILIKFHFFGEPPCSCGGVISQFSWTQHLWFNLFFLIGGIWAIILKRTATADEGLSAA